ncbi:hypothetical protein RN001_005044 [Aquatica leii]|uniref:Nuclease HARBI1 n=1 Tax=Aquatica leii TaxID=1421715 RepID=A0AAN7P634_9COLE|nr:hypothetical protein RN001_005044 [Aquatica leii]
MDLLFDIELFDDIDELELIEFGVPRNIIVRQDYFVTLPDYKFFKKFRLQKDTVLFLLPFIEEQLQFPSDINNCVSPINQLLTCLRYFATAAHIDIIADYMGMDPSTAGRIIHRVSRTVASLYPKFINMPNTDENRRLVKANFSLFEKFTFRNFLVLFIITHYDPRVLCLLTSDDCELKWN